MLLSVQISGFHFVGYVLEGNNVFGQLCPQIAIDVIFKFTFFYYYVHIKENSLQRKYARKKFIVIL